MPSTSPDAARACLVHVIVDTHTIRRGFAHEKPPVLDDEWDAQGYLEQRASAYREALADLRVACRIEPAGEAGEAFGAATGACDGLGQPESPSAHALDGATSADDRVHIVAPTDIEEDELESIREAVFAALRPLRNDARAWLRFLRPAYFERHRAWRRAVGGPIQH